MPTIGLVTFKAVTKSSLSLPGTKCSPDTSVWYRYLANSNFFFSLGPSIIADIEILDALDLFPPGEYQEKIPLVYRSCTVMPFVAFFFPVVRDLLSETPILPQCENL